MRVVQAGWEARPIAISRGAADNDFRAERFDAVEVGADLREARVLLRRSLPEVARDLRIRHVYLLAIEEGRLDDLPGAAYRTGFLRAYGNYLGLDGNELADRLKVARDAAGERDELQVFAPVDEGHLPTRSLLLLAAVLAVAVYGVWYFVSNTDGGPVERVAALPDRLASLLEGEPGSSTEPPAPGPAGDATPSESPAEPGPRPPEPEAREDRDESDGEPLETVAAIPERSIPRPESTGQPPQAEPAGETPAEEPANVTPAAVEEDRPAIPSSPEETDAVAPSEILTTSLPAPAPPVADNAAPTPEEPAAEERRASAVSRVVLRATTDSWIEIRSDDEAPLYSGLLREGESYAVPERRRLTMVTGNAGGLDILVDGEAVPRLGPPGAVLRNIDLDPDSLRGRADP